MFAKKFYSLIGLGLALPIASATAQLMIDSGTISVTAGSNFDGSADPGNRFHEARTLDGLVNEGNRDAHLGTHWLAANGTFTEAITYNLGSGYALSHMDVLNTSNTNWNDSETDTFTIAYSSDGTTFTAPSSPVALQDFKLGFQTVPLSGTWQHIRLVVTNDGTVDGDPPPANEARVGLNEVRFFQIPEPGAVALGAIGLLLMLRRRRR